MKKIQLYIILLLLSFGKPGASLAQKSGIISGKIYNLQSKANQKLLDVSNSSIENSANVDCWTDAKSDAQRWIVRHVNNDIYTLTNVASGKLLHATSSLADSVNVDQDANTGNSDVKWILKKAGNGSYYLKSAANKNFSLNVNADDTADGTNVILSRPSTKDNQNGYLRKSPLKIHLQALQLQTGCLGHGTPSIKSKKVKVFGIKPK